MSDSRRLFLIYLSALAVLLLSVIATIAFTELNAVQLENDAKTINMSGRQRALSQRIAYLGQDLHFRRLSDPDADLTVETRNLQGIIEQFEQAHDKLVGNPEHRELYYVARGESSLDARVRQFVEAARDVAEDPANDANLETLRRLERQDFLKDLNTVVFAIEAASVSRVSALRLAGRISIAFALAIILIEIFFVFLPGHRLIERAVNELSRRNETLDATLKNLRGKNLELAKSHNAMLAERARVEKALEESEALRSEQVAFTYAVSHDLKSPANTLLLVLDELAEHCDDSFDDVAHELVDQGRMTLSRMSEQVDDVLAYAMATERRAAPEFFDLADIVDEVCRSLRADIAACGAEIAVGSLDSIWGFRDQITSLLQNLVGNALKYQASEARPRIDISSVEIPATGGTCVTVADNGIGIAPENHKQIFGLFKRLHLRSEYPGSGLGLSTCARIARNHGGEIAVTSEPGKGSTFRVTLHDPRNTQASMKAAA